MLTLFKLDDVRVAYDGTDVLREIRFQVNDGEFVGIIGPNGSGKSTLLRTMVGVLNPVSGSVTFEGREVRSVPRREIARKLAVVPQESHVAFEYTVLDVVFMGRSPHLGRFEMEKQPDLDVAVDALSRTNLLHLAERRIGTLSGGERQRAMIARGLAQQADVLLLDEPTAHLDINYQVEILDLVKRENAVHGKTVIVVLHDLNLAAEFCDRLLVLRDGRLFADGTPDEVITAENVRDVYGTAVWVRRHPTSGRPYVLSVASRGIASRFIEDAGDRFRVHVICGGGTGLPVFTRLLEMGCEVTAGVINIGDADQEAAESLGIEYVEDAPFSPISEAARGANEQFIEQADAVIVAEVPFGSGNLANLHCAVRAMEFGKHLAAIGRPEGYSTRDFTGGDVARLLSDLVSRGAAILESADRVADWVAKVRGTIV